MLHSYGIYSFIWGACELIFFVIYEKFRINTTTSFFDLKDAFCWRNVAVKEPETSETSESETGGELSTPLPSNLTSEASLTEDDELEEVTDADQYLLLSEKKAQERTALELLKGHADDEEEEETPWEDVKECLLLLLESRIVLKEMIQGKLKEERIRGGLLSVNEIQDLLRIQKEDQETDWVTGMQEWLILVEHLIRLIKCSPFLTLL